jgi:hypothetical protein
MNADMDNFPCTETALPLNRLFSAELGAVRLDPVMQPSTRRTPSASNSLLTGERQ